MSEQDDARAALAAGRALGSLTPEEREEYDRYLRETAEGRHEADEFARVADQLGADAPAATPSADLKARLMAQIAVTPQEAPMAAAAPVPVVPDEVEAPPVAVPAPVATPATPQATPAERRARQRWFRRPAVIVAAAAAAVVLFAGGTALGVNLGNTSAVTAQADTLAQISAAPDAQRSTSHVSSGGTATLVWSAQLGKSAMVVDGVAPAPSGKTYQLWYIRGGQATSAGLMASDGSWQVLDGTMKAGDTVGLTVEPKGGSKQPTTPPVAAIAS